MLTLGALVLPDKSFGVSLDRSAELMNLLLILDCVVELFEASWSLPRHLYFADVISAAAPMLYQGEPKNSSFLSSMDKAALPSMCPCTLESASTPSRLSLCLLDYTTTLGIMAMLWALVSSPTVDHSLFLTTPTSP